MRAGSERRQAFDLRDHFGGVAAQLGEFFGPRIEQLAQLRRLLALLLGLALGSGQLLGDFRMGSHGERFQLQPPPFEFGNLRGALHLQFAGNASPLSAGLGFQGGQAVALGGQMLPLGGELRRALVPIA